ncbi:MAG TPA: NADPH-dependent FMN reductase [Hanamia sp.]|jgi:chromate reductase, NAD(P)H dehydrogenase (quinone)|nr:NADPH-dependent FMN reductase [Hanamia sp.]
MYTIISGTNRVGSHTEKVAKEYKRLLAEKNIDAPILSLQNLNVLERSPEIKKLEKDLLIPATKFIFIIPEYNGSYPGVLKSLIDNSDIKLWHSKKALLTGVATGRAGNLRGMDHLADVLHYLKMNVHYNKLPISVIDKVMDQNGHLNQSTLSVINEQISDFIDF